MTSIPHNDTIPDHLQVLSVDFEFCSTEQTVEVKYELYPEGNKEELVSRTITFDVSVDPDLAEALQAVTKLVEKRARRPVTGEREYRCESCCSACCFSYDDIQLYEADIPGLCRAVDASGLDDLRERGIVQGYGAGKMIGYLGRIEVPSKVKEVMAAADRTLPGETTCMFLAFDKRGVGRCSIYQNRPYTCRAYPESDCTPGEKQAPPEPLLYKLRPFKQRPPSEVQNTKGLIDHFETRLKNNTEYVPWKK